MSMSEMFVAVGSTNVSCYLPVQNTDGTDATSLTITDFSQSYIRSGSTLVNDAAAAALGTVDAVHTDWSGIEISSTSAPGLYRFDWPDAAFVTGVREVILTLEHASTRTAMIRVHLTGEPENLVCLGANTGDTTFTGSSSGAAGIKISGASAGTAHALEIVGGATAGRGIDVTTANGRAVSFVASGTGNGLFIEGSGTNGHAFYARGSTNGHGILGEGRGTNKAGFFAYNNATNGPGMVIQAGTEHPALEIIGGSTSGDGINITTNDGDGISSTGGTAGHGLYVEGGATGRGLYALGGATSGNGAHFAGGGNGIGIFAGGSSNSSGVSFVGAGSGHGMNLLANALGSGNGLTATGGASGDGIDATSAGVGTGIAADMTGDITGTIDTVTDVANEVTADVAKISGSGPAADNLEAGALGIITGTTSGTPTKTATDTDLSGYVTSELVGRLIVFTTGTGDGQAATITAYTSTNGVVEFAELTTAPSSGATFVIV